MKLYLCPVCSHANHEGCYKRHEVTEAQEKCQEFKYKGSAEFIFYEDCPCCEDSGMPYQDKFGAACSLSGCEFRQDYLT